jgi:hypothetical protein
VDTLATLQQVNENLSSSLLRFRAEQKNCSSFTPQDFASLLSEILRGAECLPSTLPFQTSDAMRRAMGDYRLTLEKLREFLPELHNNLLTEKSRLETAQTHIAAASAWARSNAKTL